MTNDTFKDCTSGINLFGRRSRDVADLKVFGDDCDENDDNGDGRRILHDFCSQIQLFFNSVSSVMLWLLFPLLLCVISVALLEL